MIPQVSTCVEMYPLTVSFSWVYIHYFNILPYDIKNNCSYPIAYRTGEVRNLLDTTATSDFEFENPTAYGSWDRIEPGTWGGINIMFSPQDVKNGAPVQPHKAMASIAVVEDYVEGVEYGWPDIVGFGITLYGYGHMPEPPTPVIYAYGDEAMTEEINLGANLPKNVPVYLSGERGSYSPVLQTETSSGITSYKWKLETPDHVSGVAAQLLPSEESPNPYVIPDRCGSYSVSLYVEDGYWNSQLSPVYYFTVPCETE